MTALQKLIHLFLLLEIKVTVLISLIALKPKPSQNKL